MMNEECGMKQRREDASPAFESAFIILHSAFPSLALARIRTRNSTFEASNDLQFHHEDSASPVAPARTAGAARLHGLSKARRARTPGTPHQTKKPRCLPGTGVHFLPKTRTQVTRLARGGRRCEAKTGPGAKTARTTTGRCTAASGPNGRAVVTGSTWFLHSKPTRTTDSYNMYRRRGGSQIENSSDEC